MDGQTFQKELHQAAENVCFERRGVRQRLVAALVTNPLANYLPAGWIRALLRFSRSELAAANWKDPGGWRSMVISYENQPTQLADKILVKAGAMSMALRNRRRLAGAILGRLLDQCPSREPHVLCLGAGPGYIIADTLSGRPQACATLVDLSDDAFAYGRTHAESLGLAARLRFVLADARDIHRVLDHPPDVVKMIGLCEYLSDSQILAILNAVADTMPNGAAIVVNSLSPAHGTDRFFRRVLGLNMIHRSPAQMRTLLASAGFVDFLSLPEPLGVYHILVAWRGPASGRPARKDP